ncbi:MAG: extensin family protein [Hyphomicrobium sp.]|uniref:extensin-like domain-containing protein n=1 Tax=Hyphomicrobium sp. TaxID=82 RepID=UPI003D126969
MKRRDEPIPALSSGLSYVMLTGLALLVALPSRLAVDFDHPSPAAVADTKASSSSEGSATPSATPASPDAASVEPVKDEWPEEDIARGREQCMHVLAGTEAEIEWLEPIKKGACGLPAPVRLKSIGSDSKVVFDPPVDVNCRMVEALGKWVKSTLQPKARERLKSEVVRIVGASGYSCRNIYNRPNARLSQHALANAIDIGGFGLANGRTVRVLKGWGLTARDIKAQAEAKAKAEADAKAKAASAEKKDGKGKDVKASARLAKAGIKQAAITPTSLTLEKKPAATDGAVAEEPAETQKPTKEALFLRAIHGGACSAFGTVLGPEANDPHRNHFHLDLIPRRKGAYCE